MINLNQELISIKQIANSKGYGKNKLYQVCRHFGLLDTDNNPTKTSLNNCWVIPITNKLGYTVSCFTLDGLKEILRLIDENKYLIYYLDIESTLSYKQYISINTKRNL